MRTVTAYVRLSLDEHRRLEAAAARAGLPLGTWLRSLGLAAARRGSALRRTDIVAKLRGSISDDEADAMREELRTSRMERS